MNHPARVMGPIERALRESGLNCWTHHPLSQDARFCIVGARISLGIPGNIWCMPEKLRPDVLSEAIEAAEALGL